MKRLGTPLSTALRTPSLRTGVLALCASATLALAACGSSDSGSASSSSASSSASAAASTNSAGETLTENFAGSEALAQASEAAVDTEEVQTTEQLYSDVQGALAGIQPASTSVSQEDTSSDIASDTETVEANENAVESYVSAETTSQLEAAATGTALDQYLTTATEYALAGWHVEGTSTVVGTPRIADGDYKGQSAKILEVCLDSSQVKVLDANGNTVSAPQFTRSLNIFTLVEENGAWKIASHDFPNNADC
ncbi:hypothetical protein E4U03_00280 [Rothia nasimurium]|uniref:ARC6 IMS domain-containing protein n=1 Tax=Rothia nasimurium TaxID=85336 RepID=A0A4Y9F9H5_9MICC|nr:hypothetical protein [Rothia nasimurium]MBF0807064.1 hypothetical protein [Rothia nasimurium]TFU24385.1 hypothetical protein E4U03_00280 [Rothia nasimurium]